MEFLGSLLKGLFLYLYSWIKKPDPDIYREGARTVSGGMEWLPVAITRKSESIFGTGWGKSTYAMQVGRDVVLLMTDQNWASKAGFGDDSKNTTSVVVPNLKLVPGTNGMYLLVSHEAGREPSPSHRAPDSRLP